MTYKQITDPQSDRLVFTAGIYLPGLLLSFVSFFISWSSSGALTHNLILQKNFDVWFDADAPAYYSALCSRWSPEHFRSRRHPLFPILTTPLIWVVHKGSAIEYATIIRGLLAISSTAITLVMYMLFLHITRHSLTASLWTMLFQVSVAHFFWCAVPETFLLGSLSLVSPFLSLAIFARTRWEYPSLLLSTFFAFAVTVTNIMSGLACAIMTLPVRKMWEMIKTTLCLSILGISVQSLVIPPTKNSIWFIPDIADELRWVSTPEVNDYCLRAFLVLAAGVIAPEVDVRNEPFPFMSRCSLTTQAARYQKAGQVGCVFWFALLLSGITYTARALNTTETMNKIFISLLLVAGGQLLLHSIYGRETILYSAHYGPVFLLLSAYSSRILPRTFVVTLVAGLFCLACANNLEVFFTSVEYLQSGRG